MTAIDEDEARLYDRQIRLWGLSAQQRIKSHRILVQSLNLTTTEVLKNLVLAGIKSVHIELIGNDQDEKKSFLIKEKNAKVTQELKVNLSELNPRVEVSVTEKYEAKIEDLAKNFNTVILSTPLLSWKSQFDLIHAANPSANIVLNDSLGLQGFAFFYFGDYEYQDEENKGDSNEASSSAPKPVTMEKFPKIDNFINLDITQVFKDIKKMTKIPVGLVVAKILLEMNINVLSMKEWEDYSAKHNIPKTYLTQELIESMKEEDSVSMGAIVGGFISQVVLKAISKNKSLGGNAFFFNGYECSGQFDWYPKMEVENTNAPRAEDIVIDEIL